MTPTEALARVEWSRGMAAQVVSLMDSRFRMATGPVDLLAMSRAVSPDDFRLYINSSRLVRSLDRLERMGRPEGTSK